MKLSEYAKLKSISYQTAHKHWKQGLLNGEQLKTGTIVVFDKQAEFNVEERLDNIEKMLKELLKAKK